MNNKNNTNWNISTDIYGIVDSINGLKGRYIEDENESTLALGIFGFVGDTEAKKIQTSTIMAGQMGNEMFPTKAKLTKNVLAHAIYNNITDINAVPAQMTIVMGIKSDDMDLYMIDDKFYIDSECPIFIGEYEFHFDYDIIIDRYRNSSGKYVYSAHYDMSIPNRLSDIVDTYLKQPFEMKIDNFNYIIFQAKIRQVTIEKTIDKIISESIIDNKTYTFEFQNQLSDFEVVVTDNGEETRLTPIMNGASTDGLDKYCNYLYISDNLVRITFDSKSYIPGLNSDIVIKAYTTLGSSGNFKYKNIDDSSDGLYVDIASEKYNYNKITCYLVADTDSLYGSDRKTKTELQKLIPKAALSRGSITTEKDVNNYFNLIDSEENRLVMRKKVDNQLARIWYGYFLLKDELNNIIPTNTIKLRLYTDTGFVYKSNDGRFVLPAGSIIKYDPKTNIGEIIDEADVPELYSDEYFYGGFYYYMNVYNLILNPDPLYAAFYLTISNKDSFYSFDWVNEESNMQFVANRCHFERNLLTDQSQYRLTFNVGQSIASDFGLYLEEKIEETDVNGDIVYNTIITNNMKMILVLYKDDAPYRWTEATIKEYNGVNYVSSWELILETDNSLDTDNDIKLNNLFVAGSSKDKNYGYFNKNTKVKLYTLAKFTEGEYGRYNLDSIAPGFEGYTVTNVYDINNGINLYENFTDVLDTKVKALDNTVIDISGVPCVGFHYMTSEDHATYLVDAISEKKAYIEYCLEILENSMDVDFKFFNTYGYSNTYTIGDKENTPLGNVDITLKFRLSIKNNSDIYTKDDITTYIKEYIEDLYETEDLHIPNLITSITNKFESRINFIEFMNFNNFRLGVQHITKLDNIEDPHIVPEFINVRNIYDEQGNLIPGIEIELV